MLCLQNYIKGNMYFPNIAKLQGRYFIFSIDIVIATNNKYNIQMLLIIKWIILKGTYFLYIILFTYINVLFAVNDKPICQNLQIAFINMTVNKI